MPSDPPWQGGSFSRRSFVKGGAAAALAWGAFGNSRAQANDLRVGALAPEATLTTLDGERISSRDLMGSVVVLTFWATWCEPCREELPLLSRYVDSHSGQGLKVLGFSLDGPEQLSDVRKVAATLHFPVGLFGQSSAPGYGRIWRLPVNFTIDRAGRLVNDGWKEKKPAWTAERLERIVTPLLGAGA